MTDIITPHGSTLPRRVTCGCIGLWIGHSSQLVHPRGPAHSITFIVLFLPRKPTRQIRHKPVMKATWGRWARLQSSQEQPEAGSDLDRLLGAPDPPPGAARSRDLDSLLGGPDPPPGVARSRDTPSHQGEKNQSPHSLCKFWVAITPMGVRTKYRTEFHTPLAYQCAQLGVDTVRIEAVRSLA